MEVGCQQRQKQETKLEGFAINTSMVVRIKLAGGISDILKEDTTGFTKCTRYNYKAKLSEGVAKYLALATKRTKLSLNEKKVKIKDEK